jgi:hypothetical protein
MAPSSRPCRRPRPSANPTIADPLSRGAYAFLWDDPSQAPSYSLKESGKRSGQSSGLIIYASRLCQFWVTICHLQGSPLTPLDRRWDERPVALVLRVVAVPCSRRVAISSKSFYAVANAIRPTPYHGRWRRHGTLARGILASWAVAVAVPARSRGNSPRRLPEKSQGRR